MSSGAPIEELGKKIIWGSDAGPKDLSPASLEEAYKRAAQRGHSIVSVASFRGSTSGDDPEDYALFETEKLPMAEEARKRNILREQVEMAHHYGLITRTYLNAHHYGDAYYKRHKEWAQVFANGEPISSLYGHAYTMCVNTSYRDNIHLKILEVARQGVDIIFLDGPAYYPGCCYCPSCREKFKDRYSAEIPEKEDWKDGNWRRFVRFRYRSILDFLTDAQQMLKEANLNALIYSNTSGQTWPVWSFALSPEDLWEGESIIGMESYQYYAKPKDVPVWLYGWTTKFGNSVKRGKAFCLFLSECHENWTRYLIPQTEFKLATAQGIANNANYLSAHRAQDFVEMTKRWEKYLTDLKSAANVALLWSKRSGDYVFEEITEAGAVEAQAAQAGESADQAFQSGDYFEAARMTRLKSESERRFVEECRGFYEALVRLHIPFDLIGDTNLNAGDLTKYSALILPNAPCMSDEQIESIRQFVQKGGGLIASYRTSLANEVGDFREDFALADVFGAHYLGQTLGPLKWDFMRIKAEHPLLNEVPQYSRREWAKTMACPEFCLQVEPTNAIPLVVQLEPMPARYWKITSETPYPTIVVNQYGEGRVVYFPGTFGGQYWNNGFFDYLRIIKNALAWVVSDGYPVEIQGPDPFEVTVYRGVSWYILHFVNYNFPLRRPFETLLPIKDITVRVKLNFDPSKVTLLLKDKNLKFQRENEWIRFIVPELNLYEGILVQ